MSKKNPDSYENLKLYIKGRLHETSFRGAVMKMYKYLKRSLLVTRIIRYTFYIVVFIETSAVLITAALAFVIMIPLIVIALLLGYIFAKNKNKKFVSSLVDSGKKSIQIVFDDKENDYEKGEIPGGEETIVVSSSLWTLLMPPRKINRKNYFVNSGCYYMIKRCDLEINIINNEQLCENNVGIT